MDYKELLYRCKTHPGWLSNSEQKEIASRIKYRTWVDELDEEYMRGKNVETKKTTPGNKT